MTIRLSQHSKILIIKPSALGDIVHSLPFLHAVKKEYPASEVHWVIAKSLHPFLEGHPLVDRFWIFDKDQWRRSSNLKRTLPELRSFSKGLRSQKFDVSVDLSGLLRSGLITLVSGATYKVGFDTGREGSPIFYTHKVHGDMSIHAIDRYLKIAEFLGCDTSEIQYPFAPHDENPAVCNDLPEDYCVIVPSAGKEANRWPAERFGELASELPVHSVLLASAGDKPVVRRVMEKSSGRITSLAGKTSLKDLIPVIRRAKFMVSNDTGPMHIAAAFEVPVFAIFGPANPARTGPYGAMHTVIRRELECSPCYAREPCGNWRCMEEISVRMVLDEISARLPSLMASFQRPAR